MSNDPKAPARESQAVFYGQIQDQKPTPSGVPIPPLPPRNRAQGTPSAPYAQPRKLGHTFQFVMPPVQAPQEVVLVEVPDGDALPTSMMSAVDAEIEAAIDRVSDPAPTEPAETLTSVFDPVMLERAFAEQARKQRPARARTEKALDAESRSQSEPHTRTPHVGTESESWMTPSHGAEARTPRVRTKTPELSAESSASISSSMRRTSIGVPSLDDPSDRPAHTPELPSAAPKRFTAPATPVQQLARAGSAPIFSEAREPVTGRLQRLPAPRPRKPALVVEPEAVRISPAEPIRPHAPLNAEAVRAALRANGLAIPPRASSPSIADAIARGSNPTITPRSSTPQRADAIARGSNPAITPRSSQTPHGFESHAPISPPSQPVHAVVSAPRSALECDAARVTGREAEAHGTPTHATHATAPHAPGAPHAPHAPHAPRAPHAPHAPHVAQAMYAEHAAHAAHAPHAPVAPATYAEHAAHAAHAPQHDASHDNAAKAHAARLMYATRAESPGARAQPNSFVAETQPQAAPYAPSPSAAPNPKWVQFHNGQFGYDPSGQPLVDYGYGPVTSAKPPQVSHFSAPQAHAPAGYPGYVHVPNVGYMPAPQGGLPAMPPQIARGSTPELDSRVIAHNAEQRARERAAAVANAEVAAATRARFVRRTYLHLLTTLGAVVALVYLWRSDDAADISTTLVETFDQWALVAGAVAGASIIASLWARAKWRALAYLGLAVHVVVFALLAIPMLALADDVLEPELVRETLLATGGVLGLLTLAALVMHKDFSFVGGALAALSGGGFALAILSLTLDFSPELVACAGIATLAGLYVLAQTARVLRHHRSAAGATLSVLGSFALVPWYLLRLLAPR